MRTAALLLFATPALAAPVPRHPEPPLTAERLAGTWAYAYRGVGGGEITFANDGTYYAHHGGVVSYWGNWSLDGDRVELLESRLDCHGVPGDAWQRYEFRLEPRAGGVLGGEVVTLSNRRSP